ncbi:hypothetical protein ACFU7D_08365 [Nocardioides sp. NPDC057577]
MNHKSSFVVFAVTLIIVFGFSQLLSAERHSCKTIITAYAATDLTEVE